MSDSSELIERKALADFVNRLAGDYVENWVGEQIAEAWQKDKIALRDQQAVIDALEEKLNRITQWCKAYPRTVFIEPTPEQWARADHVLQQASDCPSLAAISGSNMRHVVEQIARLEKSDE